MQKDTFLLHETATSCFDKPKPECQVSVRALGFIKYEYDVLISNVTSGHISIPGLYALLGHVTAWSRWLAVT